MIDANYSGIPIWMATVVVIIVCKNHYICMGMRVEGVLFTPHVIRRVIHSEDLVLINLVLRESD